MVRRALGRSPHRGTAGAGAIGVAALGTVFFARAGQASPTAFLAAAELVSGVCLLALALVGLLPRHTRPALH